VAAAEVVQRGHGAAELAQALDHMAPDIARSTHYKNIHFKIKNNI
jgi:hypothetical protein